MSVKWKMSFEKSSLPAPLQSRTSGSGASFTQSSRVPKITSLKTPEHDPPLVLCCGLYCIRIIGWSKALTNAFWCSQGRADRNAADTLQRQFLW